MHLQLVTTQEVKSDQTKPLSESFRQRRGTANSNPPKVNDSEELGEGNFPEDDEPQIEPMLDSSDEYPE